MEHKNHLKGYRLKEKSEQCIWESPMFNTHEGNENSLLGWISCISPKNKILFCWPPGLGLPRKFPQAPVLNRKERIFGKSPQNFISGWGTEGVDIVFPTLWTTCLFYFLCPALRDTELFYLIRQPICNNRSTRKTFEDFFIIIISTLVPQLCFRIIWNIWFH